MLAAPPGAINVKDMGFEDLKIPGEDATVRCKKCAPPHAPPAPVRGEAGRRLTRCASVRRFHLEPEPDATGNPTGSAVVFWEINVTETEKRPFQIQFSDVIYRFNSFTRDVSGLSPADFSMEAAQVLCDNPDLNAPLPWVPGLLTSTVEAHEGWGMPLVELPPQSNAPPAMRQLSDAAFQALWDSAYTLLSPAEEAARVATCGASCSPPVRIWCVTGGNHTSAGPDNLLVSETEFVRCDGSRRNGEAVQLTTLEFDSADASECFQGSGRVQILKQSEEDIYSSGRCHSFPRPRCAGGDD